MNIVKKSNQIKSIFTDKASLILRKMLTNPKKKWVIRDFTGDNGVSIGLAQGVLEIMSKKGYIERIKRGPSSFSLLTNIEQLINDWASSYRFEANNYYTYYSADKNILAKLKKLLKNKKYALTLHSGANLTTSFVITDQVHLYFISKNWQEDILYLRQQLDLKELVRGGNIHFINPLYKKSVFYNCQLINGYSVVSKLQLYLDLYNFKPRGKEHAEYLKQVLQESGKNLYEH